MTLRIDTARALRSHSSHVELVRAIVAAPPSTQETQAVEWKSTLDLDDRGWRARVAKGILGFANRDPDVAVRWFEGCAYFVGGASPGEANGTKVFDAAKVESMLMPYLGKEPAGPVWSSDYVEVDGKSVLVVTVEPPRWGSHIWTLRKEYAPTKGEALRVNDIFVRHHASTERATQADIDMLTRRAAATGTRLGGLSIVMKAAASAVPLDLTDSAVEAWVESERQALRLPPEPSVGPTPSKGDASAPRRALTREDILATPNDVSARLADVFGRMTLAGMKPDPRTREKYQAELDGYLKKGAKALRTALVGSAFGRNWGRIELLVRNDTPDNYHGVEVELYIDAPVVALFEEDVPHTTMPKRPIAFGKDIRPMFADAVSLGTLRVPSYLNNPRLPSIRRAKEIDNSASARIPMPAVDVRPRRTAELDTFYLFARPELAGTTVTAVWTATATDASGDMEGTIDIPVMDYLPTTEELLAKAKDSDEDADLDDE